MCVGVSCLFVYVLYMFYCLLVGSFRGELCVENIDDCVGVFCGNGTCADGVNTFMCECEAGYTGIECDSGML